MDKMSFSQYFESKRKLKSAGEDSPRFFSMYEVSKYCKLPLLEEPDSDEKTYISLKPKDELKILWELTDLVHPVPKYITVISEDIDERKYYFSWNLLKINKWLGLTTHKK